MRSLRRSSSVPDVGSIRERICRIPMPTVCRAWGLYRSAGRRPKGPGGSVRGDPGHLSGMEEMRLDIEVR